MQKEMLEFQRLDGELRRMKRDLEKNEYRVQGIKNNNLRVETESQMAKLDAKISDMRNSIANIEKEYQKLCGILNDYQKLEADMADSDEVNYMKRKITIQTDSIQNIDRDCRAILRDAEGSILQYEELAAKLPKIVAYASKCNSQFNKIIAEVQPRIKEMQQRQNQLEKILDPQQLALYKKIREHDIHPVFVEYNGSGCGGCRMEISGGAVTKLNEKGQIRCEHCGRIIFKNN